MDFKFNLNVMNLNWDLLTFKVVESLTRTLTFSRGNSTFCSQLPSYSSRGIPPTMNIFLY